MKKVWVIIECWNTEDGCGANAVKVLPTFEKAKERIKGEIIAHCLRVSNSIEDFEDNYGCEVDDYWQNDEHTYWSFETDGYSIEFYIQEVEMAE